MESIQRLSVILLLAGIPATSFGQTASKSSGDVNADGRIDISDAIYILNWKFLAGPAPAPIQCPPVEPGSPELEPSRHWKLDFSEEFFPRDRELLTEGRSPFLVLEPRYQLVLAGEEDGEEVRVVVTVLDELEAVGGVATRVVEEREWQGGELSEVSRIFVALSATTGDAYWFGESIAVYEDGAIAGYDETWRAGEGGAEPGVLLPGSPMIGARYYQASAPGAAMDRAEVIAILDSFEVPAGEFENVLFVYETSAIETGEASEKLYAPGVGMIKDGELELVAFGFLDVR
ncbi:MAG: hypothetical protein HY721_30860 [Planctomycetes bacterium]|nr:hypothetical protein [Planctomycetota bacterium]